MGDYRLLNKTSIAIVGSRKCDEYGIMQAKRFASYLSQQDICIISGLAVGIDTIAHLYSMDNIGKTIAVVASGFEHIYPEENKILFQKIIENGGAIISEHPPRKEVDMHEFPKRNRIISGLSDGVLIVEAGKMSGSTITGRYAIKQNKELFCIPGNLTNNLSVGTNLLISEGAMCVTTPQDIIETLEFNNYEISKNSVNPEFIDIYKNIGEVPISASEIANLTGKSLNEVNEKLFMLEIDKFIKKNFGGKYTRVNNEK